MQQEPVVPPPTRRHELQDELAREIQQRVSSRERNPQQWLDLNRTARKVLSQWRRNGRSDDVATLRVGVYRKDVAAAVYSLPSEQKQVLLLHVNEGLTYSQIAQRQGMQPSEVLHLLTRAYSTVRAQLEQAPRVPVPDAPSRSVLARVRRLLERLKVVPQQARKGDDNPSSRGPI